MLRLSQVIKPWKESAALNSHINLYGFWNQTAFLTKSGDLGMVLQVGGVDYESLDHAEQEYAVKRLEAALKAFGPGFHVYQYLFKTNRPEIPFARYADPVVEAANDQRQLVPMAGRIQTNVGTLPENLSADAGYFSAEAVTSLVLSGVDRLLGPSAPRKDD